MKPRITVMSAALGALLCSTWAYAQEVPSTDRVEIVLGVAANLPAMRSAVEKYWQPNHPGVEVVWSDGKLEDTITTRVRAGDYPDLTMLYQVGMLNDFLDAGVPVVSMEAMGLADGLREAFDERFLTGLGRDGKLYALPWAHFVNSVIFYNRKFFADNNLAIPQTYDQLVTLTDQIKGLGQTPWCAPEVDGSTSGWLGYDWVMDAVLGLYGIDFVNEWNAGLIKNTDPRIKAAWEQVGRIRLNWDMIYGGKDASLGTTVFEGATGISNTQPTCVLFKGESWASGILGLDDPIAGLSEMGAVGMFPFPNMIEGAPASAVVNGNYIAVLKDSVEARSLAEFLYSEEFFRQLGEEGNNAWLSANRTFDVTSFHEGDEYYAQVTAMLKETPVTTSEAPADAVPLAVAKAKWSGFMDYLKSDGANLDAILQRIDDARP